MTSKQLLETFAELESRIAMLYERFAAEFREVADVGDLWASMGREELHHADVLAHAASTAEGLPDAALLDHLRQLEAVVARYERDLARIVRLQDALRATADLEDAEADHVHAALQTSATPLRSLAEDPRMQHRLHRVLEHAIQLFGTPALQHDVAGQHSHE